MKFFLSTTTNKTEEMGSLLDNILFDLPQHRDARGALTFVQNGSMMLCASGVDDAVPVGFDFERAFWIYDVPTGAERGGHAHRTCAELLVAVHGSFDLELNDGQDVTTIHLDRPDKAVLIRPMVWCRLYNFSTDFVGLCLASQEYLPQGYINSYDEFVAQ